MQPKFMNTCANKYPLDEHNPMRNNLGAISVEMYLENPCHRGEWLCVASFLDINAGEFFQPPPGVPFAMYYGDKWIELTPMVNEG